MDIGNNTRCTIVGLGVPDPENGNGIVRIGSGKTYLELSDGNARIIGAASEDKAVDAVMRGIESALELNPYYVRNRLRTG